MVKALGPRVMWVVFVVDSLFSPRGFSPGTP